MTRFAAAAAVLVLLLAACDSTADATTTSTATNVAEAPTCEEYVDRGALIAVRVSANLSLSADTFDHVAEGSTSFDDGTAVFVLVSEDFAEIEEGWRDLSPVPPGWETFHALMLQGLGKLHESSTLIAEGFLANDFALVDNANELSHEGTDLMEQAEEVAPSSC